MSLAEETIRTVVWGFVLDQVVQAFTLYLFFRLAMTGRGIFERKPDSQDRRMVETEREEGA